MKTATGEVEQLESLDLADPPPLPSPKPKDSFTQAELRTYDFTGWDWRQLPYNVWKAARNGGPSIITKKIECVQCGREMWACNPELENLCEEDDYLLRTKIWELRAERAKRNNMKPVNPFGESSGKPNKIFWQI